MAKQFLDKLGLEELMKKTIALDSAGDAIEIEIKDHHKLLKVKYDDETIKLSSEGELSLPLDLETIVINSEGLISAGYDDKAIVLDADGKLTTQLGGYGIDNRTIFGQGIVTKRSIAGSNMKSIEIDGAIFNRICNNGAITPVDVVIEDVTTRSKVNMTFRKSEHLGEWLYGGATPDDMIATDACPSLGITNVMASPQFVEGHLVRVYTGSYDISYANNDFIKIDNSTITLDSESALSVPIDGTTIIISEGKLSATFQKSTAVEPIIVSDDGEISLKYDADTLVVTSEGVLISPRGLINGVELKGDHNTEEAKITWWGTVEEYNYLKDQGLLNEYTLYVIDSSEGYIPATPNYNSLINKPQLNHVELTGDKTLTEIGIQPTISNGTAIDLNNNIIGLRYHAGVLTVNTSNELFANTYNVDQIDNMVGSMRTIKVVSVIPADPSPNTLYYVETGTPSLYNVYLYDSDKTQIPLGTSNVGTYSAGLGIDIDTFNVISIKRDLSISAASTNERFPASSAVYNFLMQPASATADGERGLVPQPMAGDEHKLLAGNGTWVDTFGGASVGSSGYSGAVPTPHPGDQKAVLRGDGLWVPITDNCTSTYIDRPLSAAQGKYLEDRLGTDVDWTTATLDTTYVDSGSINYKKKNSIVTIAIESVKLKGIYNVNIGTLPIEVRPERLMEVTMTALNNNNAPAALTIDASGVIKVYGNTGQYAYTGTLTYTV